MNTLALICWKAFLVVQFVGVVLAPAPTANAQRTGDAQHGKEVFERLGCSRCHGTTGEGMALTRKDAGPPKISGTHLSFQEFVQAIRRPNGQMPPFTAKQVTDDQLSDVYAFLSAVASRPKLEIPSSANSQNGERLYRAFGCYECHGYQGQGSLQTGGSRIGPPQIPYSGFVDYIRQPAGQMPPYTSKAVSDTQLADIYAFLRSRPKAAPSQSIPMLHQ